MINCFVFVVTTTSTYYLTCLSFQQTSFDAPTVNNILQLFINRSKSLSFIAQFIDFYLQPLITFINDVFLYKGVCRLELSPDVAEQENTTLFLLFTKATLSTMSTSKKHRDFLSEPMRNKPVTALPGVGPVLGERMSNIGYDTVSCDV